MFIKSATRTKNPIDYVSYTCCEGEHEFVLTVQAEPDKPMAEVFEGLKTYFYELVAERKYRTRMDAYIADLCDRMPKRYGCE